MSAFNGNDSRQERSALKLTLTVGLLLLLAFSDALNVTPNRHTHSRLNKQTRRLTIDARVQRGYFSNRLLPMHGYHFLCWDGGRAAFMSLLLTSVPDDQLQRDLEALGAKAGENLSQATWSKRADPEATEPRTRVNGSRFLVNVLTQNGQRYAMSELIVSKQLKGLDVRLGGNLALRPQWRSGCILCLVSCPGGRLSNATYTMRDYYEGTAAYRLTSTGERILTDKSHVKVEFVLVNQ